MYEISPAVDIDRVTVKVRAVKDIVALINDGDFNTAIDYLESIIDVDFRAEVRKTKEELYFKMRYSKTAQEREHWKRLYTEYMENSLF